MADRKQRLAALSAKAGRAEQPVDNSNNSGNDQEEVSSASSKPTISFRNYVPKDASLDPAASTTPMQEDEEPITKRQKTNTTDQSNKEDKTQKSSSVLCVTNGLCSAGFELRMWLRMSRGPTKCLVCHTTV